jgi:hypothetical protein
VQVIGTHYVFAERRKADHLQKICAKFPATEDDDHHDDDGADDHAAVSSTTRLMLVHDPKGFAAVDPDERVLAFAGALRVVTRSREAAPPISHSSAGRTGHNHGGQIGLETFGIRWTLPRAVFPVRQPPPPPRAIPPPQ